MIKKLFSFVSLKWKLSLSFILLALGFIVLYVVLAKRTFESDKISYIFESQQRQVISLASLASNQIERVMFDARSIIAGFDVQNKKFSRSTQPIFWDHPQILALEVILSPTTGDSATVEKMPGLADLARTKLPKEASDQPILTPLENDRFALKVKGHFDGHSDIQLIIVFDLKTLAGDSLEGQSLAFVSPNKVVKLSNSSVLASPSIEQFLTSNLNLQDTTSIQELDGKRHLVSAAQVGYGGFRFFSFIEEAHALGALQTLYRRSVVFIAFSFFASVIISLLLSNRLTQNIKSLTHTAELIGTGDFSKEPDFKSNDEVGILAGAFRKMAREIQRLLNETVDKTRMETELKTARLVQDSLFPRESFYKNGNVRLYGTNKTTTECGGDWWFYYQKGSELYVMVADATGHGIPAALITSAARSLFAYIKDTDADLKQIASSWDKSIFECSNGKVNMTAYLLQINVELGECHAINAGHEPPIRMSQQKDGFTSEYLVTARNHSLGERKDMWIEDHFQLKPGDRLVIFTDGLLAIRSPDGKGYSEKRFLGYLNKLMSPPLSPEELAKKIDADFVALGAGQPLPDDVTLVALDYRA